MPLFQPFKAQNSNTDIRQFTPSDFSAMLGRIGYLYNQDPYIDISVVNSGGNLTPANMTDTRYRSGAFIQTTGDNDEVDDGGAEYAQESQTGEPELLSVATFDRLEQTIGVSASQQPFTEAYYRSQPLKPVKWDADEFREMSYGDLLDTFVDGWYQGQTNPSSSNAASGGAYFVSPNASETGATRISSTPVFIDTVANASSYSASLIGGSQTVTTTVNFGAASGTGSTSSAIPGVASLGSGVAVNVSSTSASGVGYFGFGDSRYGGGSGSARPAGTLQYYMKGKVNHNGDRSWVMKKTMYDAFYPQLPTSRQNYYNGSESYVARTTHGYPVSGDTNIIGWSGDPTHTDSTASYTGSIAPPSGAPSNFSNAPGWDVSNSNYLYLWADGEADADTTNYVTIYLHGKNGNGELIQVTRDTSASALGLGITRLANAGLITSSGSTYDDGDGRSALRLNLDGKCSKIVAVVAHGSQGESSGWAVTSNTTATATNNTGSYLTIGGISYAPFSSWTVSSSTSWSFPAGFYTTTAGSTSYQDHFNTTTYYLHQMNLSSQTQGSGYRTPLVIDYDADSDMQGLRAMTYAEFDTFFSRLILHVTSQEVGYRLRYNINGNGYNIGSPILNKQMVGVTGAYTRRFVNLNDYRAQEFPNGTVVNQDTWRFKLERY